MKSDCKVRNRILMVTLTLLLIVSMQLTGVSGLGSLLLFGEGSGLFDDDVSSSSSTATFTPSEKILFSDLSKAVKEHAAVNPGIKGWMIIPGTNINMPIAYSNQNNNYYLYRDWKGTNYTQINWQNWANYPDSVTYIDYRATVGNTWATSSNNLVLYGHNWTNLRVPYAIGSSDANNKNHRMLAQLGSYNSLDFAKSQPHIYYSTGEEEGIWRIFAVGYTEISVNFYYNNANPTAVEQQEIVNEWKRRSIFNYDVDVKSTDKLLTLSTCTRHYGPTDNQRFVVVARLLRPGESDKDAVTITVNPNVKAPDFSQPKTVAELNRQQQNQNSQAAAPETSASAAPETSRSDDGIELGSRNNNEYGFAID